MSINTDFYGNKNDWIALSKDAPDLFKTAYTYGNSETYQGSLKAFQESSVTNPENVASPELDDSIIPWKINEKSAVFNQKYIYPYCTDYTNPQQSTWMYQSSDYTQNVNGGFRFFIQDAYFTNGNNGPNGVWVYRYSPLNTKAQLDQGNYKYLFPIVGFDYSKCYIQISLLYVPKSAFDDITKSWTAESVNSMSLKDLIDDDTKWQNNYFYGIQYALHYTDLGRPHSLGMFAYDKIKASPYSGGYYPYGEDFNHYQTAMTCVNDTGQMGRCQIGGVVGGPGNGFTIRWDSTVHTDIIELFKKNYDDTHCLRHMGGLKDGENIVFNRQSGGSTVRLIPCRTYEKDSKQDLIEYARKQAAYLGFPFSDYSYNMIDNPDKTYIPEINSNGVTTGNYALASTQPDYVNAKWTTDVYDKTPYDPKNDKADNDPNHYANGSSIIARTAKYSYGTIDYLMSQEQLFYLFDALNTEIAHASQDPEAFADDMIKYFGTTNPYELFDAIIIYPRDFSYGLWRGVTSSPTPVVEGIYPDSIFIGNTSLSFSGPQTSCLEIKSVAPLVINEEQCIYFDKFKNFLDYQPYSVATMNVPWCGGIKLDPELYIGKNIEVGYTIDIQNGLCKAFIEADGKLIDTINGQVGARVALNAQDFGAKINAAIQATQIQQQQRFNQVKSAASLITGGALAALTGTGGADVAGATVNTMFGMAQSELAIDQANYRVEVTPAPIKQICSGSDTMSLSDTAGLELLIQRPKLLPTYNKDEYGHLVGFATLEFGTLTDYHGYTEIESIDFDGVAATEAEQEMIKSALKTGVYLP